jgi:diketogulonate reductase-like aldo/keto reductase
LALGTFQSLRTLHPNSSSFSSKFGGRDVSSAGAQALQTGFIHLDSAQMYNNEVTLGKAISEFNDRSKLFITTKLAEIPHSQTIRDTLVRSCRELQVDYVDLFLIHTPKILSGLTINEVWSQLEAMKEEGLAKSIGVSNFRIQDLEELLSKAKVVPAVNQVRKYAHKHVLNSTAYTHVPQIQTDRIPCIYG